MRLYPDIVQRWTAVRVEAAQLVEAERAPCDDDPWIKSIRDVGEKHGFQAHPDDLVPQTSIAFRLCNFIEDVSLPSWPEPRRDLIEFAFAVLDSDVMLFRSVYAKRHMIMRLKQSELTDGDIQRSYKMLRRAVTLGTGLEEYRAWCKLAAHLVANGHLSDLAAWLYPQANGAYLNNSMADGRLAQQFSRADLSDADMRKLVGIIWRSRYAIAWPDVQTVVDTKGAPGMPGSKSSAMHGGCLIAFCAAFRNWREIFPIFPTEFVKSSTISTHGRKLGKTFAGASNTLPQTFGGHHDSNTIPSVSGRCA